MDSVLSLATEFSGTHPLISLTTVVTSALLVYSRPKAVFKTMIVLGFIFCAIYVTQSLNSTLDTSVHNRDAMLEVKSGD